MRTRSREILAWALAACLLLALAPATVTAAEGEGDQAAAADAAPMYRYIVYSRVDPAMADEFEQQQKRWVAAFREAGFGPEWQWWVLQGPNFEYVTVWAFHKWAEFDDEAKWNEEMLERLGKEKLGELMKPAGLVLSQKTAIVRHLPEMSMPGGDGSMPGFINVETHYLRSGMEKPFRELAAKVREAYAKAEKKLPFQAWQVKVGEGTFVFTTAASSAAEFHGMPQAGEVLMAAFGEETTKKLYEEWRDCISGYETVDYQPRPDLSYVIEAEGGKAADKKTE
ncbi:MAG: hypothetical protein Kow0062_21530 [Acidobacteriota bacterium]